MAGALNTGTDLTPGPGQGDELRFYEGRSAATSENTRTRCSSVCSRRVGLGSTETSTWSGNPPASSDTSPFHGRRTVRATGRLPSQTIVDCRRERCYPGEAAGCKQELSEDDFVAESIGQDVTLARRSSDVPHGC
jgi:hypothetical protein